MKQQQIVNAYKVIKKYEEEKLPLDISLALFKLKKRLQDQWDFEIEQERKIFDKYQPEQGSAGSFNFKSKEDEAGFAKDIAALLNMDVDWDEDKIKIDFGGRVDMSLADVEALDDFITF